MACYRPLKAWQLDDGSITFLERGSIRRDLNLPCGKCIGCYLERSRVWAVRCMHEAQMFDASTFITLTYAPEHLPERASLHYPHFRDFMRRLRRRFPDCRFFMCGEYGSKDSRPHYHACLFGVYFSDRKLFKRTDSGSDIYTSDLLSSLWPYGYSSLGDVTFESAAYVARYVTKKAYDPDHLRYMRVDADGEMYTVTPEFCQMSRRPGIGAEWWRKYGQEVLNRGNIVMRGQEMKVPRYYAKLCKDPGFDWIDSGVLVSKPEDCTPERLLVREIVAEARLQFKKRDL